MSRLKISHTIKCLKCENIGVHGKGLCNSCYHKDLRSTKKGKAYLKLYNQTKGREAQKRYLEKFPKKVKLEKVSILCSCGQPSMSKGMCHKCYHKDYARQQAQKKGIVLKERKKIDSKINISDIYNSVVLLLEKGFTISSALKKIDFDRTSFYRRITPEQKKELLTCKKTNNKFNKGFNLINFE